MKALTLWEPWASLIAAGAKIHETRTWPTPYRGPLAIHAGKRCVTPEDDMDPELERLCVRVLGATWATTRPAGAIVAIAELVDCVRTQGVVTTEPDRIAGNFAPGRYAWRLANVRPLPKPVTVRGAQGLWEWTAASVAERSPTP